MTENGEYDPSYKVGEFMRALETSWNYLFFAGQQLSLDGPLVASIWQDEVQGSNHFKVDTVWNKTLCCD